MVAILKGTARDTGLDIGKLEGIAAYFREVRKKYAKFEGSLRGVDARILVAQVPGGMLTNMESQLKEQGAADKMEDVLAEIPRVREDLGFIPLVTPTSQIVGTQSVNYQGDRGCTQRRVWRDSRPGKRPAAAKGAGRCAARYLPPGRFTGAGTGCADRRITQPGPGKIDSPYLW